MRRELVAAWLAPVLIATSPSATYAVDFKDLIKNPRDLLPLGSGVLGGAACRKFFEGKNQNMATAICAAGGAWLGTKLKQYLDQREQAQLAEATYKTLDSGKKEAVQTDKGTTITTEVVQGTAASTGESAGPGQSPSPGAPTGVPSPAPSQTTAPPPNNQPAAAAEECRTVRQTIVLKNGDRYDEDLTACKRDGKWVPQKKS